MVVTDANDARGFTHRDETRVSPVLHPAVHNLLDGLKEQPGLEFEIIYGKQRSEPGENRREGNLHFIPVSYRPLPLPGMGGPFLARTFALLRHLRLNPPDIVHGQGTEREAGLVAALSGRPSILTLHGNFRELAATLHAKPWSYFGLCARFESFILPRVSGVHCLSQHTKDSVRSKARKTWIIPNAVDRAFFQIDRRPSTHPSVVCMAGIAEWKNPLVLVKASDRFHEQFPDAQIHFHGSCDPAHPYGQEFLEAIRPRPWCVFHGLSDQSKLTESLATATCAVLPSKQENFGLALAEAMAAGVPVIGANVGGIPDLITDGETGFLFNPENSDSLAEYLIALHRDKQLSQRLGIAAKSHALTSFEPAAVAESHARMYREALSGPHSPLCGSSSRPISQT